MNTKLSQCHSDDLSPTLRTGSSTGGTQAAHTAEFRRALAPSESRQQRAERQAQAAVALICADPNVSPTFRAALEKAHVNVEFVRPPIPARGFDYMATFEGYEPGDPQGVGPSAEAAVAELIAEASERNSEEDEAAHSGESDLDRTRRLADERADLEADEAKDRAAEEHFSARAAS